MARYRPEADTDRSLNQPFNRGEADFQLQAPLLTGSIHRHERDRRTPVMVERTIAQSILLLADAVIR